MADSRKSGGTNNAPTLLALLSLMGVTAGLIGLTAMVLPQIMGFALVIGGFILFGTLQYLVWGRWLPRTPIDEDDESEDAG